MGANQQTSVPAFTAGQVLTAQQQTEINTGIPVFADSTARTAAFGGTGEKVLAEGQYSYLEDTNSTEVYDGSSWVSVGGAPLVYITQGTFSAVASVSMPAGTFTTTYKNYKVILNVTSTSGHQSLNVRVNVSGSAQTGSNYYGGWAQINNSGTVSGVGANANSSAVPTYLSSNRSAKIELTVYDPANSGTYTNWSGTGRGADSGDTQAGCAGGNFYNLTAAHDGLTFSVSGTFGGTYYVYGIKDS